MVEWFAPQWNTSDLVPGKVYAKRGFCRSFEEINELTKEYIKDWNFKALPKQVNRSLPSVVLLGGAGLLGSRIAKACLEQTKMDVVIVSRNPASIKDQWLSSLGRDQTRKLWLNERLKLIQADLTSSNMDWMEEIECAKAVFHLTARVHAFLGWDQLVDTNLGTLKQAIALAHRDGALLQLASTLSLQVSSNWCPLGEDKVEPSSNLWLFGGYAQTKAAAELALHHFADRFPTQILRYGLLVPEPGVPYAEEYFAPTFIKVLEKIKVLPEKAEFSEVDLTSIDCAAQAALTIMHSKNGGIFHWANPEHTGIDRVINAIEDKLLVRFDHLPKEEWISRVNELSRLEQKLVKSAFFKSDFLQEEAAYGPYLNADLFQSTLREFSIHNSLSAGCVQFLERKNDVKEANTEDQVSSFVQSSTQNSHL